MAEIYSVSQVSTYISGMFAANPVLDRLYIRGEVSNCKYHSSGHLYFTLKDSAAQIACVMFAGRRTGISFRLTDGQSVIVFGSIRVYERDGKYQLYAEEIRQDGIGRLYEEFEYLKEKLGAEGLFSAEHKKPVPAYAGRIGVVTAATGAAIQDILQISRRRNPYVQIVLYPAKVQGDCAADSIVRGIERLDGRVDLMIVGRGGGSLEDLWAFNEEKVARAIYACRTPVISAVGHETDTTIADFVADLRAPTPSAAAELAVYEAAALKKTLAELHAELVQQMLQRLERARGELTLREARLRQFYPEASLNAVRQRLLLLAEQLPKQMKQRLWEERQRLSLLAERLEGLSPMARLSGGYAFVTDEKEQAVTHIGQVSPKETLRIEVTDGAILAEVVRIIPRQGGN